MKSFTAISDSLYTYLHIFGGVYICDGESLDLFYVFLKVSSLDKKSLGKIVSMSFL